MARRALLKTISSPSIAAMVAAELTANGFPAVVVPSMIACVYNFHAPEVWLVDGEQLQDPESRAAIDRILNPIASDALPVQDPIHIETNNYAWLRWVVIVVGIAAIWIVGCARSRTSHFEFLRHARRTTLTSSLRKYCERYDLSGQLYVVDLSYQAVSDSARIELVPSGFRMNSRPHYVEFSKWLRSSVPGLNDPFVVRTGTSVLEGESVLILESVDGFDPATELEPGEHLTFVLWVYRPTFAERVGGWLGI